MNTKEVLYPNELLTYEYLFVIWEFMRLEQVINEL